MAFPVQRVSRRGETPSHTKDAPPQECGTRCAVEAPSLPWYNADARLMKRIVSV
jgi:hypothetical protein